MPPRTHYGHPFIRVPPFTTPFLPPSSQWRSSVASVLSTMPLSIVLLPFSTYVSNTLAISIQAFVLWFATRAHNFPHFLCAQGFAIGRCSLRQVFSIFALPCAIMTKVSICMLSANYGDGFAFVFFICLRSRVQNRFVVNAHVHVHVGSASGFDSYSKP